MEERERWERGDDAGSMPDDTTTDATGTSEPHYNIVPVPAENGGNVADLDEGRIPEQPGRSQGLFGRLWHNAQVVHNTIRGTPGKSDGSVARNDEADSGTNGYQSDTLDDLTREMTKSNDIMIDVAKWTRRRDIPIAILAWSALTLLVFWLASHVTRTIILLVVAGLLAYALAPLVTIFQRVMPRFLAILIVYLIVLGGIVALLYFVVVTAIDQVNSLAKAISSLLSTPKNGQLSPLMQTLQRIGVSPEQVKSLEAQLLNQAGSLSSNVLPVVTEVFNVVLDIFLIAVLSIYLLIDGSRVTRWLRRNMPVRQRGRINFLINTLQRVVGGYIRGQLLLCGLIGLLVGVGMWIIGVPYALLLGVLAFFLEFIPILGTLTSGLICVLLALTKGWVIALIVLAYFIIVHIIEGDVVGPRIVGQAVGLHPVVSIAALIAGGELFGIWGALFGSPIAGVIQAVLVTVWAEWREMHPQEFQSAKKAVAEKVDQNVAPKTLSPDPPDADEERLLS